MECAFAQSQDEKKAEGQDMVEVSGQRTHRCNCKAVTMNY